MGAPRLESDRERKRENVLEQFDWSHLQETTCLDRLAEAVSAVADVPTAYVALMKSDVQCVMSGVGMSRHEFVRDNTFCAHTITGEEVIIVRDATRDARFADNPFVQHDPGIRFYAGLPIIVDDVPVGTMCAIDYEPRTLRMDARSELFGLLHTAESYLNLLYEHDPDGRPRTFGSKVTEARATMTTIRHRTDLEGRSDEQLVESERDLETCLDRWVPDEAASESALDDSIEEEAPKGIGYEETEPIEELGYEETDVESK